MANFQALEQQLVRSLELERRPVAIAFMEQIPAGVPEFQGTEPSGCSFWRLAREGRTFYTLPAAHANCPIGSYTHNIPPSAGHAGDLDQALSLMMGAGYVKAEEVPGIFRLPRTPAAVVYAPLGDSPVPPDVVVFCGRPGRMMRLIEAAVRAGTMSSLPLLPRPTCMALPAALAHGLVASTACIGNRVYTEIGDDELYAVVPGRDLDRIAGEASTIASANTLLAQFHSGRKQDLQSD